MGSVIDLIMWASQQDYRMAIQALADRALEAIGAQLDPQVVLVGVAEDPRVRQRVCVEPQTGLLTPSHLAGVAGRTGRLYEQDRVRAASGSDSAACLARDVLLRCRVRSDAIAEASDALLAKRCLVSSGGSVDGFDVHVVVAVDRNAFNALPTFEGGGAELLRAPSSFAEQVIWQIMAEADAALRVLEPRADSLRRSPEGVVREAAEQFCADCMYRTGNFDVASAFSAFNAVTVQAYESSGAAGRFLLAPPDHPSVEVDARLVYPVPLHAERAVRKLLRTTGPRLALLVHEGGIYGLGRLSSGQNPPDVFEVLVTSHATWELRQRGEAMLRVAYGRPSLPSPKLTTRAVSDTLDRVFGPDAHTGVLMSLIAEAATAGHGTTLVISSEAAAEAERMAGSATLLVPEVLTPELLSCYAEMDGAVLIDPAGMCHAIVILDGKAQGRGDPSRGARYNSALRYYASAQAHTVVVIVSQDGGVDIVPKPGSGES